MISEPLYHICTCKARLLRHGSHMSECRRPDPQADCFRPPDVPILVHCMHCNCEYESYLIKWEEVALTDRILGFWHCPTPGCDGVGFGFDILPADPDWEAPDGAFGWADSEYDDEEDGDPWGEEDPEAALFDEMDIQQLDDFLAGAPLDDPADGPGFGVTPVSDAEESSDMHDSAVDFRLIWDDATDHGAADEPFDPFAPRHNSRFRRPYGDGDFRF